MQLYVPLTKSEMYSLVELARAQRRRPQEQAAMLIAQALRYQTSGPQHKPLEAITAPVANEREVADDA